MPDPVPRPGELLLRVLACAVCRTDLHLVDGELNPRVPHVVRSGALSGAAVLVPDTMKRYAA